MGSAVFILIMIVIIHTPAIRERFHVPYPIIQKMVRGHRQQGQRAAYKNAIILSIIKAAGLYGSMFN